jgi:hypothetical protein
MAFLASKIGRSSLVSQPSVALTEVKSSPKEKITKPIEALLYHVLALALIMLIPHQ